MSRYVLVLVIVLITVFTIVASLYYLLPSERRRRETKISVKSGWRPHGGIRPGRVNYSELHQTRYTHNVSESDGRANLINQPGECLLWGGDDRIQGGMDAEIGDFPCIALLEYLEKTDTYSYDCTGSLINHRYVITAAHCLHKRNLVNVRLGEYDISTNPDFDEDGLPQPEPINAGIEKIIIHANYSRKRLINDIGLIRLSMDVPYEKYAIQPICIPNSTMSTPVNRTVVVPGWGSTDHEKHSSILQKIGLPIYDFEECQKLLTAKQIMPSQLCAGGEIGKDACNRDSGGPLIMRYNQRTYIEGIVSYGYGCGEKGMPGVYTRVSYFYDWILDNLQP